VVDAPASAGTDVVDAVAVVADGIVTRVVVVVELDDPPSEHAARPMAAAARRTTARLGPTMARQ